MPRILVVNDDGIEAEGIGVLARALQALGEVTVVAPDGDRSGTSHSISVQKAVRAQAMHEDGLRRFACSGTPADCVLLGVNGEPLPIGTYLNVNIPNLAVLSGVRFTRLGRKHYADRLAREDNENGAAYYWVWDMSHRGGGDDTDTVAVDAGYASITPLQIDRTDEVTLRHYQQALEQR